MDAIKSYILRERLQPGDVLPTETQLCDTIGASRSSVREAVRKLEALNIVKVEHGKGTFVGSLSLDLWWKRSPSGRWRRSARISPTCRTWSNCGASSTWDAPRRSARPWREPSSRA